MPLDHFGMIAGLYNRIKYVAPAELIEFLGLPFDGLLLDAGGGTGRVSEGLRPYLKLVVVADPSRKMLIHAIGKGIAATCTPAENLPFTNESFDRIIIVDAIHHVDDQRKTMTELLRILTQGGRLVIIEPDIHKIPIKFIAIGEKILFMQSHFLTSEKIHKFYSNLNCQVKMLSVGNEIWISIEK